MLLALLIQTAPVPPAPTVPALPPGDWNTLPALPVQPPRGAVDPSGYIRREVTAGRCRATPVGGAWEVAASVAVRIDPEGLVQRIIPQAIDCPTVEQFTAGYVSTLARRASNAPSGLRPGWYRYIVTYRWAG